MRLSGAVISEEMHLDEKVCVVFLFFFCRTGILSRGSLVTQTETDRRTSETPDRQPENTDFFFFFFIRSLNDKKEYVKGFVRQRQYNQLNSPGTLKLIESIKNDYLSTRHTKEMVRENWVITVMGERILKEKKKEKKKDCARKGCSEFVSIQRLTGNIWMMDFLPNL